MTTQSRKFRATLKRLGLSQVAAAVYFDVNPRTIRRWVSGETPVPTWTEWFLEIRSYRDQ